jgi:uncharacterized protein (TIGR03083 family)
MNTPAPLPYDAIEHLRLDGTEFIRIVSQADPTLSVPSCGDWRLGDLAFHVAGAWNFWAEVVAGGLNDRTQIHDVVKLVRPDEHAAVIDLLFDAHVRLCTALHDADPALRVWTWTGANQPIAWVARRMVHETMVHLWDAGLTQGYELEFDAVVAADGIEEWLTWFAALERAEGEMKVGGTVHLHCTDDELPDGAGEWFISSMKEPKATFTREHRKGDVAIRGQAHDIFMWLWRRIDSRSESTLEFIGDEVVARRFQAFTDLS